MTANQIHEVSISTGGGWETRRLAVFASAHLAEAFVAVCRAEAVTALNTPPESDEQDTACDEFAERHGFSVQDISSLEIRPVVVRHSI